MHLAVLPGADVAIAGLTHLSYWYPGASNAALDDVNLSVSEGVTLVTGPSGGGKSTLLRVLNGLVPHFHGGRIAGAAQVDGRDIFSTPTRRLARTVGFVFQDPELQTVYDTVQREVAFGLENLAFPANKMREQIDRALHEVGAQHLRGRRMRSLSGGERQRIALASALATQPRVVAMDEPTSQLDDQGAELVLSAVLRVAESGRSVVVSEHRYEQLKTAASAVVEVDQGRVLSFTARDWQPPALPVAKPRASTIGAEAWSLSNIVAGFGGQPVLEGVTLSGHQREVLALSGPNGGGKTTLLRLIAGALDPMSGRVERTPGRIAYLPQNPAALLHRPTVRSEIELTLQRADEHESADLILLQLGLTHVASRYPRDLSSGERQRAALAAVLAGQPSLVLLDEPTRGMDMAARQALIELIMRLRDAGSSIVLATHDRALRDAVGDRIVMVRDGQVTELEASVIQ